MARQAVEDRRAALLAAAVTVIARDGMASASSRAIAREAGIPTGAFHYWFGSLAELYTGLSGWLTDRDVAGVNAALERCGRGRRTDLGTVLDRLLQEIWASVEEFPDASKTSYQLTQQLLCDPETAPVAHRQQERYLSTVRAALVRVAEIAKVRWTTPLPILTRMTLAFIDGLTLEWVVDRDSRHSRQALRAFGTALLGFATPVEDSGSRDVATVRP